MTDRPLRILQVLRAPVGGLFRHVADLTRELSARGHAVGVVVDSFRSDSLTAERLAGLRPAASLGIHSLPIPRVFGPQDVTTPLRIRHLARQLGVNVLHGHGAKGGYAARLARWGRKGNAALYTPHGGVLHFDPRSTSGRLFRAVEQALLPISEAIIFESAFAKAAYEKQIAVPSCPTPVIHNGLAPAEFEAVIPHADAADFVFIGELRSLKGINVLIEALAKVHAPDGRPATLVMAGDGPDRQTLERRINDLGLKSRVQLLGAQPARPTFARGRCLVVPSLAESLPYVILEGAAAGRPIISTAVGGIAEIFGPTASRLLPAGDVDALAGAMQAFLDDPRAAELEASNRLAFIRERFSLGRMVDQIEALYRDLLAH